MARLIAFASGKGGVGKSLITANLAWILADLGHKCVLADLDCGASNAHTLLGLKNTLAGVAHFFNDKNLTIKELLCNTSNPCLQFLPGDSMLAGAAAIPFLRRRKLMKELAELDVAYVLVDLGAGTSWNMIDLYLACHLGILVSIPEPTSVLNAYSFLKNAVYRLAMQSFSAKSEERTLIHNYFRQSNHNIPSLIEKLGVYNPQSGEKLAKNLEHLKPRVIVNMVYGVNDGLMAARLRQVANKQLDCKLGYIALCPFDSAIRQSVIDRKLIAAHQPESGFVKALQLLAQTISNESIVHFSPPADSFEDLEQLLSEMV